MVKIKDVGEEEVLEVKVDHVLKCFTGYRYHKYVIDMIQKELDYIASELNYGSSSGSIINATSDAKHNLSPWENELLTKESILVKEQDQHVTETNQVDVWLANIKNQNHKAIIIEYLINNRCENAEGAAKVCNTSPGNISNVSKRIVTNIARKIS